MPVLERRSFLGALPALALLGGASAASAATDRPALRAAIHRFVTLEGSKSFQIDVGDHGKVFRQSYKAGQPMFVGSGFKTFLLTQYLQDVEEGRLDLADQLAVDDSVRSLSSPVLELMSGTMPARMVLEAMIAHSDNTATDIAMKMVGHQRVRALVRAAGLKSVLLPDSTRIAFSYLAGAAPGVDKGWAGMEQIAAGRLFGKPRPAINPVQSMMASCNDMVDYYRRALKGEFLARPESLVEFKRIQAMADSIARAVPPGIAAYAKGGSIDWQGFHALSFPGQMILGRSRARPSVAQTPVTFCFTLNWHGPDEGVAEVTKAYITAVQGVLAAVEDSFG